MPLQPYNINPSATAGRGPYGLVPGTIGLPPSNYQQTVGVAPGLGDTTQLTNNIMSELHGDINPQALKNMQDAAASYGVSSGMPGSNAVPGTLAFNKNLRNIGLDTLQVQSQGLKDYLSALAGIGGQQLNPALMSDIAAHNAQLQAAPDPQLAAEQQLRNYWNALNALKGPGGGTGQGGLPSGGTGRYAPQVPFTGGTPGPAPYRPYGSQNVNYNTDFGYSTPSGSGLGWTGTTPPDFANDLFGDFGAPPIDYAGGYSSPPQTGYNPVTDQSFYDPYSQFGGYDQSAPPDFSGYDQAFQNPEDYYAGLLTGGF